MLKPLIPSAVALYELLVFFLSFNGSFDVHAELMNENENLGPRIVDRRWRGKGAKFRSVVGEETVDTFLQGRYTIGLSIGQREKNCAHTNSR